jgi:hypothetical protein
MKRLFLALILLLIAIPANAEIKFYNGYFTGQTSDWTETTPGFIIGIDITKNCRFKGNNSTVFDDLPCVPLAITGADAFLVTGTAGTSGNCAEWNADGDLVDAGAACGVGGGGGGGASQLSDLSDVTSAGTTNRYALLANGSAYVGRALTVADISDIAANYYTETEVDNIATDLAAGDTGGPICSAATPTTTWTPSVDGCAVIPATITGPQSTTVNDPGAVGSGNVEKLLTVTASGGTVTLDLSAYSLPTDGLSPPLTIANGETRDYLIWTDDSGTTWHLTSDTPDLSTLSAVTLATGDLLEVQDVSATPDVHGKATIDDVTTYVGANVSINDSQVAGNQTTVTDDTAVTGDDHGKTIVCNKGTAMTIDVDDGTVNWSANVRVYVLNIGAGDCTIQDGGTADVTVRTATGFTAVVPQYSGATIIGINSGEVVVTGGEAS